MERQHASDRVRLFFSAGKIVVALFTLVAVALSLATPENLYEQSSAVRAFVDWMATGIRTIDEFAGVSRFPGTTRVVLALLWALVPLVVAFIWIMPIRWDYPPRMGLMRLMELCVVAGIVFLPLTMQITPADLEGSGRVDAVIRLVSSSRMALGILGGLYCGVTAWLLAYVPRLLSLR
jgi:hypothetical protein